MHAKYMRIFGVAALLLGFGGSVSKALAQRLQLINPVTTVWKYDQSGVDLGTAWRAPDYPDSSWAGGPGIFYAGD